MRYNQPGQRRLMPAMAGVALAALVSMTATTAAAAATTIGTQRPMGNESGSSGGETCFPDTATTGICTRVTSAPSTGGPRYGAERIWGKTHRSRAGLPSPPAQCEFGSGQYVVNPDRFTSCTDVIWELFTYTHIHGTTEITGSMNLEDLQWNSYDALSLSWTHGLLLTAYAGASGTLADGASAYVKSQCDYRGNPCKVTQNLGPKDTKLIHLSPGSTLQDGWTEKDTGRAVSADGEVDAQKNLGIKLLGPPGPHIPPWKFTDAYLTGRCDSVVVSGTPPNQSRTGCVNQDFIPTLSLPLPRYGASAAMIKWAQENLSGHWGLRGEGQPLHRLISSAQSTNYRIICRTDWKASEALNKALMPYKDKDSCDEFPFKSTYESGAMKTGVNGKPKPYVTTGANCAQVTAVQTGKTGNEPEDWPKVSPIGTSSGTEPCVRGHIPLKLNSGVGGAYISFCNSNRIVDKDAFWVSVTS
jgi:hypothetical protein